MAKKKSFVLSLSSSTISTVSFPIKLEAIKIKPMRRFAFHVVKKICFFVFLQFQHCVSWKCLFTPVSANDNENDNDYHVLIAVLSSHPMLRSCSLSSSAENVFFILPGEDRGKTLLGFLKTNQQEFSQCVQTLKLKINFTRRQEEKDRTDDFRLSLLSLCFLRRLHFP